MIAPDQAVSGDISCHRSSTMAGIKMYEMSTDGIFNENFGNAFKSSVGAVLCELHQGMWPSRMPEIIINLLLISA